MAAGTIRVTEGTDKDLQTFDNGVLGHAEAVVLVDSTGSEITGLPVSGPLTDAELRATPVDVSGTFFQATQPVSGTVNVGNFPATQAVTQSGSWFLSSIASTVTVNSPNASNFLATVSGTVGVTANSSFNLSQVVGTTVDTNSGNKSAGTQRVVIATDQPAFSTAVPTKETRSSTVSQSTVAPTTTNGTLLAANANRLGATLFHDDTLGTGSYVRVLCGNAASSSNFTVNMAPGSYYEVPFLYTGKLDCQSTANTGNVRITEFTA